ncbi:Cell envelope-related transcriptional attenuator [metagenome]|uniref:Cell envelope-related transcriptional attenuator n=1 Tax=metagenome TaxID=256318 RepID=A0A2P2C4T0_9ZZZZ
MSDRPPSSSTPDPGGPAEGTPEYDWLYGTGGRGGGDADDATQVLGPGGAATGRRPHPDATRMMPAVPRGQQPSGQATPPNQRPHQTPPPPPRSPGGGPARGSSGGGRRGFRPRPRWILYALALWLVFLVVTPILAWNTVSKVDDTPDGKRPDDQPGTTYLLVGSDARKNDTTGSRTDSIMILHTGSGPNLLMSIPRDSIVDIPGHGTTKINAAFAYGGAPLLIRTVEQSTGIRIDDYAEIGFNGFVDVVDAVGGIEVCPKRDMKDPKAKLDIEKGCQEVDGKTALAYSRSRHVESLGDIDRARRQREVISAIGKEALSPWSFINPVRYWRLSFAAAGSIVVGENTGAIATAKMFLAMTRVSGDKGLACGVPISDLAVHWDPERSQQLFDKVIDDDTDTIPKSLCTPSGLPKSVTG